MQKKSKREPHLETLLVAVHKLSPWLQQWQAGGDNVDTGGVTLAMQYKQQLLVPRQDQQLQEISENLTIVDIGHKKQGEIGPVDTAALCSAVT